MSRARRLVAALVLGAGLALTAAPALAAMRQDPDPQECLRHLPPAEIGGRGFPACRTVDGQWEVYWPDAEARPAVDGGFVALVVVLVLAWSTIPPFVAYKVARGSGQSTGVATMLGFFLGWAGLAIVYAMSRSEGRAAAYAAVGALGPGPAGASPAERLRTLTDLHESGVITDDEYATRRAAILDQV